MLVQIGNWLYQNAMAIFISAIASLLISKRYYDKANRESVLMMVIFPIVKLLNENIIRVMIMKHFLKSILLMRLNILEKGKK